MATDHEEALDIEIPDAQSAVVPVAAPSEPISRVYQLSAHRPIPATRAECLPGGSNTARPCIHSRCTWHTDNVGGNPTMVAHGQPGAKTESCVLDVADRGGASLEEVGLAMGVVRERVRQLETVAIRKLQLAGRLEAYRDHAFGTTGSPLAMAIRDSERTQSLGARDCGHQMYTPPLDIASAAVTDAEYSEHVNTFYERRLEIRDAEVAATDTEVTATEGESK